MDNNEKLTKKNQSVEKALKILEVLALNKGPMHLQDISKQTGFPPPTALRMVNTLVCEEYVFQDRDTQMYSPSFKICRLAALIKEEDVIIKIAKPYLMQLGEHFRECATLAIEMDGKVIFVDIVDRYVSGLLVQHPIGVSVPHHVAAIGKLILLNYQPDEVRDIFEREKLSTYRTAPRTICNYEDLLQELKKTAENGFAMNDEEGEIGSRCIACPIFDFSGQVYAGIGISAPSFRMTDYYIQTLLPPLRDAAEKISARLGYTGGATVQQNWIESESNIS